MKEPVDFIFLDDDPINNMICDLSVKAVLGKVNSQTFTNGQYALDYIKSMFVKGHKRPPTILLLDINMPVMSGWEFLEHFDRLPIETKASINIYILSSSVDQRDRDRTYVNKNVREFLLKPLVKETIQTIAYNFLQ